ncbi:hypothetical protein ABZ760_30725 [Streptomyces sp. NPDC006658]|uniref:hypothetical protein n=1 Tax=Streptomyces sp. NPDC006658 TaxID=3156900 RepID=UPI0033E0A065
MSWRETSHGLLVASLRTDMHAHRTLSADTELALLAIGRASVEHGFAHLKNWRILTKLRADPTRATRLLPALLVLTAWRHSHAMECRTRDRARAYRRAAALPIRFCRERGRREFAAARRRLPASWSRPALLAQLFLLGRLRLRRPGPLPDRLPPGSSASGS